MNPRIMQLIEQIETDLEKIESKLDAAIRQHSTEVTSLDRQAIRKFSLMEKLKSFSDHI